MEPANLSFLTTFSQAELSGELVQEPQESLEASVESNTEGSSFKSTTGQAPEPSDNTSISDPFIITELKSAVRGRIIQEEKHIFEEQVGQWVQKVAEDAPSDAFFGGFKKVNTGIRNAS